MGSHLPRTNPLNSATNLKQMPPPLAIERTYRGAVASLLLRYR